MSEFTPSELKLLLRLVQNLLSNVVDAELEPGILETIYYKLLDQSMELST